MDAPVCLYQGQVFHARLRPKPHRFAYRVFSILIDIDRLDEANRLSPLFSVNRFNLLSFHEKDHGDASGQPVRQSVDQLLKETGLPVDGTQVLLLCYPRLFGFAFNPISVYYVFRQGEPMALLHEVRNTFGERHTYVVPMEPGSVTAADLRHSFHKRFHVSPFLGMEQSYTMSLSPPGEALRMRILASDRDGPVMVAGFAGQRRNLTSRAILGVFLGMPLMTFKVVTGIYVEALKLWAKGLPLHPHPRTRAAPVQPHAPP